MLRVIKRVLVALLLVAAAAAAFLAVHLTMPGWYARWWYPLEHTEQINNYSTQYQLDPALVAAVIYEESSFDSSSTSSKGAVGLMQLLPSTAAWISTKNGDNRLSVDDLSDPSVNIAYGCWYLRYLLDRYGSVELALAAYNGGTENVDQWLETSKKMGRGFSSVLDIPWRETREYVSHVERMRDIYTRAYPTELGIQ